MIYFVQSHSGSFGDSYGASSCELTLEDVLIKIDGLAKDTLEWKHYPMEGPLSVVGVHREVIKPDIVHVHSYSFSCSDPSEVQAILKKVGLAKSSE